MYLYLEEHNANHFHGYFMLIWAVIATQRTVVFNFPSCQSIICMTAINSAVASIS